MKRTIWAVLPAYDREDNVYYQVLPYDFKGVITSHFEFYRGLFSLIPFLFNCRFSEYSANRLRDRKMKNKFKVFL